MRSLTLSAGLIVLLGQAAISPGRTGTSPASILTDRQVLSDFQARVQRYVELHRRLEAAGPALAVSQDWAQIEAAVDGHADRIRASRSTARQGDIFTPQIERWFRQTLAGCLDGVSAEEFLAALSEEEAQEFELTPQVNGRWPEEAPLMSMTVHMLGVLPPLPPELQYRFMQRHLILWDARANLVVDFIRDALPPTPIQSSPRDICVG